MLFACSRFVRIIRYINRLTIVIYLVMHMLIWMFKTISRSLSNQLSGMNIEVAFNKIVKKDESLEIDFVVTFKAKDGETYRRLVEMIEAEIRGTLQLPEHVRKQMMEVEKQL